VALVSTYLDSMLKYWQKQWQISW